MERATTRSFVGKYLNELRDEVKPQQLKRYARGWDDFDIIYENNGKFFDYTMWSPDGGRKQYGTGKSDHSTLVAKRKLVERHQGSTGRPAAVRLRQHLRPAPAQPAGAEVRGTRSRCRNIKAWTPPSFDASVKGKPKFVRQREQALRVAGGPRKMQTYCEEMLAVEELTKAVVREQKRRGRHEDTVYIFTADNGVAWGIHRLPQRKGVPYATPVPLVFNWPARWGDEVVAIDEVVSNIDIAPTICALAGCEMGPFKEGPEDGRRTLAATAARRPDRPPRAHGGARGSAAAPTPTPRRSRPSAPPRQHPLGRWHYIEWEHGRA